MACALAAADAHEPAFPGAGAAGAGAATGAEAASAASRADDDGPSVLAPAPPRGPSEGKSCSQNEGRAAEALARPSLGGAEDEGAADDEGPAWAPADFFFFGLGFRAGALCGSDEDGIGEGAGKGGDGLVKDLQTKLRSALLALLSEGRHISFARKVRSCDPAFRALRQKRTYLGTKAGALGSNGMACGLRVR